MKTSVIEVHDMLSVLSVDEVEKRIGEVPGVESVTLNYAAASATVRYDETRLEEVTLICPVSASSGTVAAICDEESTSKMASTVLKRTCVAPRKFAPVRVRMALVPGAPLAGAKLKTTDCPCAAPTANQSASSVKRRNHCVACLFTIDLWRERSRTGA